MADEAAFSVAKLDTYSTERIQGEIASLSERARKLRVLASHYNEQARIALDANRRDPSQALAQSNTWSAMRDAANSMADDVQKKVNSASVELDLRRL